MALFSTRSFSVCIAAVALLVPSTHAFVLPQRGSFRANQVCFPGVVPSPSTVPTTPTTIFNSEDSDDAKAATTGSDGAQSPKPSPPLEDTDDGFGEDEEGRLRIVVDNDMKPSPPKMGSSPAELPVTKESNKRLLTAEEEKLAVAAGIGGIFVGAALGGIVDAQNPNIDLYVSPLVPPVIGAVSISAFGFVAGGMDGTAGGFARNVLGRGTIGAGNAIAAGAQGVVDSAVSSAQNKVRKTTDDIKAIPSNIKKAAVAKVEETKEEIVAIPGKLQDAAVETATEIADEIKATPRRVVETTKKAVEDAVDDTLDAVEEFVDDVKAIPQKAIDNVEESINSIMGTPTQQVPRPPLAPPVTKRSEKRKPPVPPKALPPPISNERKPLIPKIDSIKIDVPKIPKVSLPSVPKPGNLSPEPTASQQDRETQTSSNTSGNSGTIFEKVTLKSFNKDISFDEESGRFFETGPTPPLEAPKLKIEIPEVKLPKLELPSQSPSSKTNVPSVRVQDKDTAKAKAQQQQEEREAARKAAALKKEQEREAKAEAARQRKEEAERKRSELAESRRKQQLESQRKAEEARQASQARKQAIEESRREKLEAQAKALEDKRRQAESQRKARQEKVKQQQDSKRGAALKAKRQQAAEKSLENARSRTTVSLGSLFGFGSNDDSDKEAPAPQKTTAKPPKGVPVVTSWRQNPDGSITGQISGSSLFSDGEGVTTSPVPKGAQSESVVTTSSGSRYFLGEPAKSSFGFSFTGRKTAPTSAVKKQETSKQTNLTTNAASDAAAKRRQEAEAKKAAAAAEAEKKQREAALKRAEVQAAAEERKRAAAAAAEEKRAAQAAAAEERKRAAAAAAEEKRAAQAAAAEERKRAAAAAAEEKRAAAAAAAEKRKQEAEAKKRSIQSKKKPADDRQMTTVAAPLATTTKPKPEKPPKGVPIIKSWKQRPDGGVSGRIYSSPNFEDGDFVETSRISKGKLENGSVVSTESGSRYFLSSETAVKTGNFFSAIKDLAGAEPGATITLTRERKEREAKAAEKVMQNAKPRQTLSLFGLGGGADMKDGTRSQSPTTDDSPRRSMVRERPRKAPAKKSGPISSNKAPRGVPTLSKWKKNADGSLTGIITGSSSFTDGERITTSPIKKGKYSSNEVVVTGSGSRYYLS